MKPQPKPAAQDVLAGLVERVTFHNSDNGFCVLRAKARGHRELVTVIGVPVANLIRLVSSREGNGHSGSSNQTRTHLSLNKDSPITRPIETFGRILPVPIGRIASPIPQDLVSDRDRSRHSRRIDPINRSAKPFCQGEAGAIACPGCPWRAIDV